LLKKSDYLLLEVLTNNKMAVALYGYPFAFDTYGLLKLKLMGCVVAFIQDLHNISNVDAMLSRSDVAHLGGDRVFVSNTYNIFSTNAAGAQLQQLLEKKLQIMVAALPRELDKMRSSEAQKRIQAAQSVVQFPGQFLDERPTFEAVTERPNTNEESADEDDPVCEVAKAVKLEFDKQNALSDSATAEVERCQPGIPSNVAFQLHGIRQSPEYVGDGQ
jgi:hypothetical protein